MNSEKAAPKRALERNRTKPVRYGNSAPITELNCSYELSDPYGDDSMEDELYAPSKKPKPLPGLLRGPRSNVSIKLSNLTQIESVNLNDEFDQIRNSESSKMSACTTSAVTHDNAHDHRSLSSHNPAGTSNSNHALGMSSDEDEEKSPTIDYNLLLDLHKNSVEILARIAVIEESLIKNKLLNTVEKDNLVDAASVKHANAFLISNKIPFKILQDVVAFENNLVNAEFQQVCVSL